MPEPKTCSRCPANSAKPARKGDVWCDDCRADYQKKYRNDREERIADQSFAAGASMIREQLAKKMAQAPGSMFEGQSVAQWILDFPLPDREVSVPLKGPA